MSSKKLTYANEVIDRLKTWTRANTDTELAERLGINKNTLAGWRFRGTIDFPLLIEKYNHLNLHWLITGAGAANAPEPAGVSVTEATLLEQLREYGWDTVELLSYLVELHALMHRYGRSVDMQSLGAFLTERQDVDQRAGQSRSKLAAEPEAKYKKTIG